MRKRLFFLILIIPHILAGQVVDVDVFDNTYIKKIAGDYTIAFHLSNYGQANKEVRVFLVPGDYYLFCAQELSFDENIEVDYIKPQSFKLERVNNQAYRFKVEGNLPIQFKMRVTFWGETLDKKRHLFSLYKTYDPYVVKSINLPRYHTFDENSLNPIQQDKGYSVHYIWGATFLQSEQLVVDLNKLKVAYEQESDFYCLASDTEEALSEFQSVYGLNWNMIKLDTYLRGKFTIEKLDTEPATFIVDNKKGMIIYHYYGLNGLVDHLNQELAKYLIQE